MSEQPHPNPWGREYSEEEYRLAASMWRMYRGGKERGRGPLVYASDTGNVPRQIRNRIEGLEGRAARLRKLLEAVEREFAKPMAARGEDGTT